MNKERSNPVSPLYTAPMMTKYSLHCPLLLAALLSSAVLLAGCASAPDDRTSPRKISVGSGSSDTPMVDRLPGDNQPLDLDARQRVLDEAINNGVLAAKILRDSFVDGGLDGLTSTLIDSDIAWIDGNLVQAKSLLDELAGFGPRGELLALAERERRAALSWRWVDAAKYAHRQLMTAELDHSGLKTAIWSYLMRLNDAQLEVELASADGADWRGWLELTQAYRRGRASVTAWLPRHLGHSARNPLPAALDIWLDAEPPTTIAVLLPLNGRLREASEAVLGGIIEALYRDYPSVNARPTLLTFDTEDFDNNVEAYRAAIERGADVVIGPLTKGSVYEISRLKTHPVPTIALNRPEQLPADDLRRWSALSLAPEDEAQQIAHMAFARGLRRALILHPDSDWGRRMAKATTSAWRESGGTITGTRVLANDPPTSQQVSELVGGAAAESRIKAVEDAFEAPVTSRPRRRQDFDVIFMLAPSPGEGRELRPLLVFHYSGDVPVYATSAIYSGNDNLRDRDLNDVITVEIPAVLSSAKVDRYTRLKALGTDALALVPHREQAEHTTAPVLRANTGILKRLASGEMIRELVPVEFAGDKLRPHRVPSTPP